MEKLFLEHVYRWLRRSGILVMVIPSDYIHDCSQVLSFQFKDVHVYRLTEPPSVKYKQVVVFGMGHENETVGDGYSKMKDDRAFPLEQAENMGLGFELPLPKPDVVRIVRKNAASAEEKNVA